MFVFFIETGLEGVYIILHALLHQKQLLINARMN